MTWQQRGRDLYVIAREIYAWTLLATVGGGVIGLILLDLWPHFMGR